MKFKKTNAKTVDTTFILFKRTGIYECENNMEKNQAFALSGVSFGYFQLLLPVSLTIPS